MPIPLERSDDTLDGRIIGKVEEQHDTLHGSVLFKVSFEETCDLHVHTHSSEDDTEVFFRVIGDVLALYEGGLSHNLGSYFVVRKTVGREEGNLLTTGNRGHDVDGRNTGL